MQFEFLGKCNNSELVNGAFFTAKAITPVDGFECDVQLPITYEMNPRLIREINHDLLSKRLPAAWSSEGRKKGFVYRFFELVTRSTVGTFLRRDIPIEKYGPLWHGCRFVSVEGLYYEYVVYEATQKKLSCSTHFPKDLKTLKSMCLDVVLRIEEKSLPNKLQDYSILPLDIQECLQKSTTPEWQMMHSNCFKTVKIWHANQTLSQEIEYDAETKKYHGKACLWDYHGQLILELYFKQGRMHGSCKTSHDVNDPVSSSMFENGLPVGLRMAHHSYALTYGKTWYLPGSCSHRIHFRYQSFFWDFTDGATDKYLHGDTWWGLLIWHENRWQSCLYRVKKVRDFWDSSALERHDPTRPGYIHLCTCEEALTRKITKPLRIIDLKKRTKRKFVTVPELKPGEQQRRQQQHKNKKKQKK